MKIKKEITENKRMQVKHNELKKKMIMSLYRERWHVRIRNCDSMPVEKIENILSTKATKKRQNKAIVVIQTAVRARLRYKVIIERRNEAARYLQRIWKRYRMISMVPKAWRKFKSDRITRIQKFIRGYIAFK